MPRRARLSLSHVPLHIIQRGNNRQACFFADEDYRFYLDWLSKHADKAGCRVHAYVLMTNPGHRHAGEQPHAGVAARVRLRAAISGYCLCSSAAAIHDYYFISEINCLSHAYD